MIDEIRTFHILIGDCFRKNRLKWGGFLCYLAIKKYHKFNTCGTIININKFKYGDQLMNSLARYENNGIELLINTETNEFILTYNKKYHDRKLSCIKEEQY